MTNNPLKLREPMMVSDQFFKTLLEISRTMAETRLLDPLLKYAVAEALKLLNAERGYIVLLRSDGELDFKVKLDRLGNAPEEEISMTILNQVLESHQAMIFNDAMVDPSLAGSESVQSLGLRSVICAPLISHGTTIGAIYIENRSIAAVFMQKELQPLTFFANQAAVSIENAILNDRLEERVRERTKELEDAVHQLERGWLDAVEANRIRTTILANVAHDIRSPIGLSISALQTIREGTFGTLNPKQEAWIDRVLESLQHAVSLTSDIFDLSKAEMDALKIHTKPVDLKDFLTNIYQLGEGLEWSDEVRFGLDIPKDLPFVEFDRTRIQQVIFNLLSNALKFTKKGQVILYAKVGIESVIIGVYDTGSGVPPHQREKIFERFQQGDQDTETRFRGTGLGLAICKELVRLHNGNIWVESEMGKYSDFKVELPL
jgi:signal transduction histidine kinase